MEVVLANLAAGSRVRRVRVGERLYYVVPVTMLVPGVLNGSQGSLYYPPEEVSQDPLAWSGMPITVYHPVKDGKPATAKDPGVLTRQGVGFVMKPYIGKGRLRGRGWFDAEKTRRVDEFLTRTRPGYVPILPRLERGEPIEVSTGLFTSNEPAPAGAFFNAHDGPRPYDFIARSYRPDHLAVLPDEVGACSVRDGCGVHVENAFCPTGAGGGIDPSCPPQGTGTGHTPSLPVPAAAGAPKVHKVEIKGHVVEVHENPTKQGLEVWLSRLPKQDELKGLERGGKVYVWEAVEHGESFYHHDITEALFNLHDLPETSKFLIDRFDGPLVVRTYRGIERSPAIARWAHATGITVNAFCPTGIGGGIDPTCTPGASKQDFAQHANAAAVASAKVQAPNAHAARLTRKASEKTAVALHPPAGRYSTSHAEAGEAHGKASQAHLTAAKGARLRGNAADAAAHMEAFKAHAAASYAHHVAGVGMTVNLDDYVKLLRHDARRRTKEAEPVKVTQSRLAAFFSGLGGLLTGKGVRNATKSQGGETLTAADFAYAPDPNRPSTWKLRIDDVRHVAGAVAALGQGYRGQKVEIPAADLPKVKAKVRRAWKKFHEGQTVPDVLNASAADGDMCPECGAKMQGDRCPECGYVRQVAPPTTPSSATVPVGNAKPSDRADVSPEKACQILKDGEVNGHPLTDKQRGMFGAICGRHSDHKNNASGEIAMNRAEIITHLTTNCDCWKGAKGKAALDQLTDQELEVVKNNADRLAVLNTFAGNVRAKFGEKAMVLDVDQMTSAVLDKSKELLATNQQGQGQQGVQQGQGAQQGQGTQQQSRLTPDEQEAVAFANNERLKQKAALVGKLVAHITDNAQREAAINEFKVLPTTTLERLVATMPVVPALNNDPFAALLGLTAPPPQPNPHLLPPNYAGAAGGVVPGVSGVGPTGNQQQGLGEPLALPTINWDEEARLSRTNQDAAVA